MNIEHKIRSVGPIRSDGPNRSDGYNYMFMTGTKANDEYEISKVAKQIVTLNFSKLIIFPVSHSKALIKLHNYSIKLYNYLRKPYNY